MKPRTATPEPTIGDDFKPTVAIVMGIFLGLGVVAGFILALVVYL